MYILNRFKYIYFNFKRRRFIKYSLKLEHSDENDRGILFFNEETKKWYNNELVDELIHIKMVKNNLKLLTFIFENNQNFEKLQKLKERLN